MRIAWVTIALLGAIGLAGCLSFDEARCADGRVCPAGSRCDEGRCISPEQIEACATIDDGGECTLVGGGGTCRRGACEPWTCGDGEINGTELCEGEQLGGMTCLDFNSRTPDGLACTTDCKLDTSGCSACGDGVMDDGEQCDGEAFGSGGPVDCRDPRAGFYDEGFVKCSAICTWDVSGCTGFCGDGAVNGTELCDSVPPPGETCLEHGFDGGRLGCSQCGRAFSGCTQLGWRRVATPTNQNLAAIWGTEDQIFVVGEGGTLIGVAGSIVQTVSTGTTKHLHGVFGFAADDVFIVGDTGTILHYDGTTVTAMTSSSTANLRAIWGTSPDDLYAVGSSGTILHYNGSAWSEMTSNTNVLLHGVWGAGTTVFAVGADGTAVHYNGTWSVQPTIPSALDGSADLRAVWGTAANDVFAATTRNEVFHFDGNGWTSMSSPTTAPPSFLAGVTGGESDDVFAVGPAVVHFDGTRWSKLIGPAGVPELRGIFRSEAGDVWISGPTGYLARWGGASWTAATSGTGNVLRSVAAIGPSDAWAVGGGGTIRRYDGASWVVSTSNTTALLTAVWSLGTSFAAAVGESGVFRHFNGTGWTTPSSSASTDNLFAVWGAATTNIFGAGNQGVVRRFDGASWSPPSMPSALEDTIVFGLWGTSATNVFAAAQTSAGTLSGKVFHFQGTSWTEMATPPTTNLAGVWGTGPNDIFAVGDAILHYDGSAWTRMTAGGRKLRGVSGTGERNVFAVGDAGTLLHYDGVEWTPIRVIAPDGSEVTANLRSVAATSRSVIVVGDGGFVQRLSFSMREEEDNCRDTWDDDGDAKPDCADEDCADDPFCEGGGTCSVARTIACGEMITGTTLGRTSGRDFYRCSANAETGGEVIYRFDAMMSGTVTATLGGYGAVDLDLVAVGAMPTSAACDPDFECLDASTSTAVTEAVTFTATAGKAYYVIVEGNNGAAGTFELSLACP